MKAVLLAAGFSKRFGNTKLLAELNGKRMIEHIMDVALEMRFEEIILVYRDEEVKRAAGGRKIRCVFNPEAAGGMSTSVKLGVEAAGSTDAYVFFVGDQPFLDSETVNRLITAFYTGEHSIIVPKFAGRKGNPVIFSSVWKEALMELTGDTGGRTIIEANPEAVGFVDIAGAKTGTDIDTLEEYINHGGGNIYKSRGRKLSDKL